MALARADLESLLRARRLDRTLTTALPPTDPHDDAALAPSGIPSLDARLGGGLRRGHVSEIVGARSSGRTSLLLQALAASTARGELVALVDALDMLDVESAAAAGIDLHRLLWIRGHVVTNPGLCGDINQRALEQAIRAFTLVLQAGNFGLVVLDVAEAPAQAIRRLPFTTWMRVQRMVEGSQTACLLVGSEPMARSSAGLTMRMRSAECGVRNECGMRNAECGMPNRESRMPHGESRMPHGESRTPHGESRMPHGESRMPHGESRTPHGESRTPNGESLLPNRECGIRFGDSLFDGLTVEARIVRARTREHSDTTVRLTTVAADCA